MHFHKTFVLLSGVDGDNTNLTNYVIISTGLNNPLLRYLFNN
jgi:hypothetical protein